MVLALLSAWVIPIGLSGAPGPPALAPPSASAVFQTQLERESPPDSVAVRDQMEDAQARFERIRRTLLPSVRAGARHPCEERIGRLCLWHEGEDDWEPVPDPSDLVEARDELLAALAGAAERIPADEWILGQRIRYLGEAGRWEDAARLARACGGAASSWCSVLEGFALHGLGRYEMALQRFRRGFETMDSEEAREWRDPSVLLDGDGSDVLKDAADEAEWEDVRARVWTLADPLYLVAGNDRESEHYARWTFSKMNEDARNAWGMRWGDDLEEIAVRYGWDRGWERIRPQFGTGGGTFSVIGHQLPNGKEFIPPGRILAVPWTTLPGSWVPEEERPQSAHVPAYAPTLVPGVAQVVVLARGDSIVVAAATELPVDPDTASESATNLPFAGGASPGGEVIAEGPIPWPQPPLLEGPEQIGLFLIDEEGQIRGANRNSRAGALYLTVPAGDYMLSVEAWAPEEGLGGRIRHGIATRALPIDLATLSDLILLNPSDSLPQTLFSAVPSMRPSAHLEAEEPLVIGWEIFGLGWRPEDVSFELSFYEEGEGFFGKIGRWFGFGSREEPLHLDWSEPGPSETGPWFRSVEVTIPDVDSGDYVFRLRVTPAGREELVRTLLVEIMP